MIINIFQREMSRCLSKKMSINNKISSLFFTFFLAFVLSLLLFDSAGAASIAKINFVEGKVDILRGGALPAVSAKIGDELDIKDVIRTKSNSKAEITFNDGNIVRLQQRTKVEIEEYFSGTGANTGIIKLDRGKVEAVVSKDVLKDVAGTAEGKRFEIHTPNAVAGVRGTCVNVAFSSIFTLVNSLGASECPSPGNVYTYNIGDMEYIVIVPPAGSSFIPGDGLPVVLNDPIFGDPAFAPPAGCAGVFCVALPIIDFPELFIRGKQGDFELLEKNPLPPNNN